MAFEKYAQKISLAEDEVIIAVLRHHPITYAKQIIVTIFLILLAFFLMFFLFSQGSFGVAIFTALLITGVFYGLREFFIWYVNTFIITSQRVIDIDQRGFFNKTVSDVSFEKIIDVCYIVRGFWQTVLKLGSIKIKTQGASLFVKNLSEVSQVNKLLTDLIREQTGKSFESKEEKVLSPKAKAQLADDFLDQDELAEYEEYNLTELINEYKSTLGELNLKKLLVDQLEEYEQGEEDEEDQEEEGDDEEDMAEVEREEEDDEGEEEEEKKPRLSQKSTKSKFKKRPL